MKKVVLKMDLYDDKIRKKAMKAVSGVSGVESLSMDRKDEKLTVLGDFDPIHVVGKLRKLCHTEIVSIGPAKEKKEEEEPAKEEKKEEEPKRISDGPGFALAKSWCSLPPAQVQPLDQEK